MSDLVALSGNVPAYLRTTAVVAAGGFNADFGAPISAGPKFPKLSIKQSKWRIVRGKDDEEVLQQGYLDVVVVASNTGVYKTFYGRPYVPGQDAEAPDCWSADGKMPSAFAAHPQCDKGCALCPQNQFGSKINPAGKKVKACTDNKRILVLAPDAIEGDLYMLNMPVMTLASWNAYLRDLDRHGVPVTGVITRISFDTSVEYPKLEFKFVGWLDEASYGKVNERMREDDVEQFRGGALDTEGTDGTDAPEGITDVTPVAPIAGRPTVQAAQQPARQAAAQPAAQPAPQAAASVSPLARGRKAAPKPAEVVQPAQTASFSAAPAEVIPPDAPTEGGDALDSEVAAILEGF